MVKTSIYLMDNLIIVKWIISKKQEFIYL